MLTFISPCNIGLTYSETLTHKPFDKEAPRADRLALTCTLAVKRSGPVARGLWFRKSAKPNRVRKFCYAKP